MEKSLIVMSLGLSVATTGLYNLRQSQAPETSRLISTNDELRKVTYKINNTSFTFRSLSESNFTITNERKKEISDLISQEKELTQQCMNIKNSPQYQEETNSRLIYGLVPGFGGCSVSLLCAIGLAYSSRKR